MASTENTQYTIGTHAPREGQSQGLNGPRTAVEPAAAAAAATAVAAASAAALSLRSSTTEHTQEHGTTKNIVGQRGSRRAQSMLSRR